MDRDELLRRVALLEATVREMLRVADASEGCSTCVSPSDAYDAEHARHWNSIVRKARRLVARP